MHISNDDNFIKSGTNIISLNNLEWLTTLEAAIFLRKTVGALRVAVHRGQIQGRKFQGRWYFRRSVLDRIIENSQMIGV